MMKMPRLRANGWIGAVLIGTLVATVLIASVWTPYNPLALDLHHRLQPPTSRHWMGTDEFGRDELSRIMSGAASSGFVALATVVLAITGGVSIGLVSGYLGGWPDRVVMILNDAVLAFPGMLLALGVMMVLGASRYGIVFALSLAYLPSVVRVVRGTVLSLREKEYIEASRVIGNSEWTTMRRHVLPNCLAPVAVLATSMFGWVLLSESALSFLGLGVPPPASTWGNMLASGRDHMQDAIWLGVGPGMCIALSLLGINLLGDALRDHLDPRMVQQ
jgi:peptide/nickel transport system permease protein